MSVYYNDKVEDLQITDIDEANNKAVVITYNKSFSCRLAKAKDEIKDYFFELENNILGHKGVNKRVSWEYTAYSYKRKTFARMLVRTNTIYLYLSLDIKDYPNPKYKLEDVSQKKKFQELPVLLKITGARTYKYAFSLLNDLYEKLDLEDNYYLASYEEFTLKYLNRPLDIFLREGLVKEIRRKTKLNLAIKRQERLLDELKYEVVINAYNLSGLDVKNLYVCANIEELGAWDATKAVKMEEIEKNHFCLKIKLAPCHLEFKVLKALDWLEVEKGIFTEEIRNHTYEINADMAIEDLVHHYRDEVEYGR